MSGPVAGFRVSVQTTWTTWLFVGSTAREGSDWEFVVTSFTRTLAVKLRPPSVDFEKNTSLFPPRVSVHARYMLFEASSVNDGSDWVAPPASLFTRIGVVQARPSRDFVKKTSVPVTRPPQPAKPTYVHPSVPTAREGVPPAYAGAWSTWTVGLKNGGVGAARTEGPRMPSRVTAKMAATTANGSVRRIVLTRSVGTRDIRVAPEADGFAAEYLIERTRFSKTETSLLRHIQSDARLQTHVIGAQSRAFVPES